MPRLVMLLAALMGLSPAAFASELEGTYRGTGANGEPLVLVLERDQDGWYEGFVSLGDTRLNLAGFEEQDRVIGEAFIDEDDDETLFFLATLSEGRMVFVLAEEDEAGEPIESTAMEWTFDAAGGDEPTSNRTQVAPPTVIYAGRYQGELNGMIAVADLERDDEALKGRIEYGGGLVQVAGTIDGTKAKGQLTDLTTGQVLEFRAAATDDAIEFVLLVPNELGQVQEIPVTLNRVDPAQRQAQDANVHRDPTLVGHWARSTSTTSGSFSMASETQLLIHPDGTFQMGGGRVVGGGGMGSFDSGSGGVEAEGEWKTEGNIVHVRDPGMSTWTPYARYYVEGASLMFTFADGTREVWKRR